MYRAPPAWLVHPFEEAGFTLGTEVPGRRTRHYLMVRHSRCVVGQVKLLPSHGGPIVVVDAVFSPSYVSTADYGTMVSVVGLLRQGYVCGWCRRMPDGLNRCGRCYAVNYCSRTCQTQDWNRHRVMCKGLHQRMVVVDGDLPHLERRQPLPVHSNISKVPRPLTMEERRRAMRVVQGSWCILDLPGDVLRLILSCVDPCSRALCREVCRGLKRLIRVPTSVDVPMYRAALRHGHLYVLNDKRRMAMTQRWYSPEYTVDDWECAIREDNTTAIEWGLHCLDEWPAYEVAIYKCSAWVLRAQLYTLLRLACTKGQVEMVALLEARLSDKRRAREKRTGELCVVAAHYGRLEVLKWLRDMGYRVPKAASRACRPGWLLKVREVLLWLKAEGLLSYSHARRALLHEGEYVHMRSRRRLRAYVEGLDGGDVLL